MMGREHAPSWSKCQFARPHIERKLRQSVITGRMWIMVLVGILAAVASGAGADPLESNNSEPIVSHIPRQPIASTAIAKVGYSKRRHILEIEFANSAVYRYFDVSPSVYRDLLSAESKARFYDFNIKGKYRSVHIRPRVKDKSTN
jgi:hypothetical protein